MLKAVHDTIRTKRNSGGNGPRRTRARSTDPTTTTTTKSTRRSLILPHSSDASSKVEGGSTLVFYNSADKDSGGVRTYLESRFVKDAMFVEHHSFERMVNALAGATTGSMKIKTIVLVDHDRLWTPSTSPLWSKETRDIIRHNLIDVYTLTPGSVINYNPGYFSIETPESTSMTDYELTKIRLIYAVSTEPTDVLLFSKDPAKAEYANATKPELARIIYNTMNPSVSDGFHIGLVPYSYTPSTGATTPDKTHVFVFDVSEGALDQEATAITHILTKYGNAFHLVLYQQQSKKTDANTKALISKLSGTHRKKGGFEVKVNTIIPFLHIGAPPAGPHTSSEPKPRKDEPVKTQSKLFVLFASPMADSVKSDLAKSFSKFDIDMVDINTSSIDTALAKISAVGDTKTVLVIPDKIEGEALMKVRGFLSYFKKNDTVVVPRAYFESASTRGGVIPRNSFYRDTETERYLNLKMRGEDTNKFLGNFVYITSSTSADQKQAKKETDALSDYVDKRYPDTKSMRMRVSNNRISSIDDINRRILPDIANHLREQLPLRYQFTLAINKQVAESHPGAVLEFARILSEATQKDEKAHIVLFDPDDKSSDVAFQSPDDIINTADTNTRISATSKLQASLRGLLGRNKAEKKIHAMPAPADDDGGALSLYLTDDQTKKDGNEQKFLPYDQAPHDYRVFTKIILGRGSFHNALTALNKIHAYYYDPNGNVKHQGLDLHIEESSGFGRAGKYKRIRTAYVLGDLINTQHSGFKDPKDLYDLVCIDPDEIYATRTMPTYGDIVKLTGNPVTNLKERTVLVVTSNKVGRNDFIASVIDHSSKIPFPFFARIIITHDAISTGSYDGTTGVLDEVYSVTTDQQVANRTTAFTLKTIKVARYNTAGSCENNLVETGVLGFLTEYLTQKGLPIGKNPGSYALESETVGYAHKMYMHMLAYAQCQSVDKTGKKFNDLINGALKKVYIALVAHSKSTVLGKSDVPAGFTAVKGTSRTITSDKRNFHYSVITREPPLTKFGSRFMVSFV